MPTRNNRIIPTQAIAKEVEKMMAASMNQRRNFERRWYDNNFFDDGFHFRYLSRTTGKIIDTSSRSATNLPTRAIPKASRQIRGIANLISSVDQQPVVYPEKVSRVNYNNEQEFELAKEVSKQLALKVGHWITEEWKTQDIKMKIIRMMILAAKHGVAFLQVWPDAVEERIRTEVFDAFDIFLMGDRPSIYDSPFIIKSRPTLLSEIRANENFDETQLGFLNPDNYFASSEVKQAYMNSRYGHGVESEGNETILLKESFVKEFITEGNMDELRSMSQKTGAMDGKHVGDPIIRHTFSAGGTWLLDEYLVAKEYPFVDFRYEPGNVYQKPTIENFIPANKSLDMVMSRVERYIGTMITGTWMIRKGEDFDITNIPGGQKLSYKSTPPVQGQMASMPNAVFNFIDQLNSIIEEQGASTSALGQLPKGVRSGIAIESVKATEFDNLNIAVNMYKDTIKRISEKLLEIAGDFFISPQSVMLLEKGEPAYFDIIGQAGIDARKKAGMEVPENVIPINGEYRVDIETESALGFTNEGRKETMQQVITFMMQLLENGQVSPEALRVVVEKFLDVFQFGSTQEFMTALGDMPPSQLNEDQLQQMKIAVLETLEDAGVVGQKSEQQQVDTTKVGVVEALSDLQGGTNG